jgi:hypothetical protein
MLASDPISLWPAWLLSIAGLFSAGTILVRQVRFHRQRKQSYALWKKLRDVAVPLGMAVFGLQSLLACYGVVSLESPLHRILLALATVGIIGGIAGFRIRRMPG